MEKEYEVTIRERTPYKEKAVQYEASDGKVYESRYSIPEGQQHKAVNYETGKTLYTEVEVYSQKVGSGLDLHRVIKAVNKID